MMTFDAQKIPIMGFFANYFSLIKDDSAENKANSNSMDCEVKCKTLLGASKFLFARRCSSGKSVPKLDPQTCGAFPLNQRGELNTQLIEDEKYQGIEDEQHRKLEKKTILYRDIDVGQGDRVKSFKYYKLMIHYNLYSDKPVFTNNEGGNVKRSPTEVHMCIPKYGEGFTKGIEGMRVGGIRRIIVRKDSLQNLPETANFKNYAVLDVELVDVCISRRCCFDETKALI